MPMSEMPMEKTETSTPTSSASCCARGVAPTRKPVFKSCDVLPALAEAMQTTPPMLMASAANAAPVQCSTRKTAQVAIRVAMAMPEMGFDDVPMSPVMREETVTNKNPKTITNNAAARFSYQVVLASLMGMKVSMAHIISSTRAAPPKATFRSRSRSVRRAPPPVAAAPLPRSFAPARNAAMMVGMVLSKVISPDAATAPAPIGRM